MAGASKIRDRQRLLGDTGESNDTTASDSGHRPGDAAWGMGPVRNQLLGLSFLLIDHQFLYSSLAVLFFYYFLFLFTRVRFHAYM